MKVLCHICIGSNYHREENMQIAQKRLAELFPLICFAKERETKPLSLHNQSLFSNQIACFYTDMNPDALVGHLKRIEAEAGRRSEDKAQERISLDIDLLSYGNRILKPEDLKRDYIVEGLNELNEQ